MKPAHAPVSASEMTLGRGCLRKWAARYVWDEWEREEITGGAVGTLYHLLAQQYLLTGEVTREPHPVVDMFLDSMRWLPKPRTHWALEHKVTTSIAGIPFEATPDWYGPSDVLPQVPKGVHAIVDYKTSIDPKRYGVHEPAGKLNDIQTVTYAYIFTPPNLPTFFRHLYMRKTAQVLALEAANIVDLEKRVKKEQQAANQALSPRTLPSDVLLAPQQIADSMERIVLPWADRVYSLRSRGKRIDPLTLPPNAAHCNEYGGCPHKHRCNLTPAQQLEGALGGYDAMSGGFDLFSALPAINGAPNTPSPTNGFTQPSAPAAPAQATFGFNAPVAPAHVAAPVQLPPGYSPSEQNPDYCKSAEGTYAKVADVCAAYAKYLAAGAPTTAAVPPAPAPSVARLSDAELGALMRALIKALAQ
jgi:hypothetical protein